jgi:lipoprotein-anchoring transpeptidase ErfK/SrfK
MRKLTLLLITAMIAGCSKEQASRTVSKVENGAHNVASKVSDVWAATPMARDKIDRQTQERERFDQRWRQLQSFNAQQAAEKQKALAAKAAAEQQASAQAQAAREQAEKDRAAQEQAASTISVQFATSGKDSFKGLDANGINSAPVHVPITGDMAGPSVLKAQVYLDRAHFSVGALDGRWGKNSAVTVFTWQRSHNLPPTGDVDEATYRSIAAAGGGGPVLTQYTITADDTKGPFVTLPDSVYEKAKLSCLCYESLKEALAEKFHVTQDFLEQLNPNVRFSAASAGTTIVVPNVRAPMTADQIDIASVIVSVSGNSFNGMDAAGNVVFHAPTTLGNKYDPSPDETVKVVGIARNPNFHYQPTLFHEVPDSDPEAELNPGPNSPVGVVWMALSKPHFGIHGTGDPESIGYASSHGCVRLANWDALEVSHRIQKGVLVEFVDTKRNDD